MATRVPAHPGVGTTPAVEVERAASGNPGRGDCDHLLEGTTIMGSSKAPFIGITIEALLKPCEIYPVPCQHGHGFVWEWAAVADDAKSRHVFDMFFDCLEDARNHGYEPHFLDRQQDIAVVPVRTAA